MTNLRDSIKVALLIATLTVTAGSAMAQDNFTPNVNPSLHVQRTTGEITIDGNLDDAGWQGAAVASNFCENDPGDQIKPPVDTKGMITYNDDYLYVAVVSYDNPADIRASLCERDRVYGDDNVGFFIDTYGDASWAYTLNVNPYGIQADAIWNSGFGEDDKYDLIWESAGKITDSGYQVELAIPFASLRFPNKEIQTWKVEFWRHHTRDVHHNISWCAYDRDERCWACQWGEVTGIENVKAGRGIEIIPALTGFQSGSLVEPESEPHYFDNLDPDGDLSLSAKYALSSSSTVELTVNPDFSQVEADADQIDVNSTTALSFPEKRPFFQEGADLFRTLYDVLYTRSINDPSFAAKATARIGRTSIAYLGAYDENSPVIMPFEEFSSGVIGVGKSVSNIVRLRQSFGDNSRIGFLATDRRYDDGGSGTVFSLDGNFRFSQKLSLNWQAITNHTEEPDDTALTSPGWLDGFDDDTLTTLNDQYFDGEHTAGFDGESFWGHGYLGILDYSSSNAYVSLRYSETSPTFRLDNGFEPRNNKRHANVVASYTFRFDEGLIESTSPEISPARVSNTDGTVKEEYVRFNLSTRLRKAQGNFHTQYLRSRELYGGTQYNGLWNFHQCGSFKLSEALALGGNFSFGNQLAYNYGKVGRSTGFHFWTDIKPSDRILVENRYYYVQTKDPDSEVGGLLYKGFTVRSRLSVQLNKELSLRFVTQYNDFSKTWDFDPLLTYRINPFTMFYIGTTYDYKRRDNLNQDGNAFAADDDLRYSHNRLKARQFFMKLQYLFQL